MKILPVGQRRSMPMKGRTHMTKLYQSVFTILWMHLKTLSSVQSSLLCVSSVQVLWSKVENNDMPSKSADYNLHIINSKVKTTFLFIW